MVKKEMINVVFQGVIYRMKRAQGLSLNVIVVAVISLVVLIVLIVIFTGKIGVFGENIKECSSKGGKCIEKNDCETYKIISTATCSEGEVCCMEDLI